MIDTWRYLEDRKRWEAVAVLFPKFNAEMPFLVKTLRACFDRDPDLNEQQFGIFGLGRLCVEDLLEILFLCEHGFGYAGLKLLRGMYERAATAEYITSRPREAQNFHDYFFVHWKRLLDRSRRVYGDQAQSMRTEEHKMRRYHEVIENFDLARCGVCGLKKQSGWTKLSLESLAAKVSKDWKKRFARRKAAPQPA